jgi:regulatory protein
VAAWLYEGQVLTDEKIAQLKADDELEEAYQRSLRLIDYRPRTETEILKNLQRHKIPEGVQTAVVARLRNAGLINDAGFARAWVENRAELRPRSRRALAYELRQRGVDRAVIDQSLENIDDEAMAYQAASRRANRFKDLEWADFRQKMFRFLAQRGFNYEAAQTAIARVWQDLHDADYIPGEEEGFS